MMRGRIATVLAVLVNHDAKALTSRRVEVAIYANDEWRNEAKKTSSLR